jgi:hypothetical protein
MSTDRHWIDPASRPVIRLTLGVGIALPVAYGLALTLPYVAVLVAVMILSKEGPPMPLLKACIVGGLLMLLTGSGLLLVPLLEHYAFAALLLIAAALFLLFYLGIKHANPLLNLLVVSFTLIPVAGVLEQAVAAAVIQSLAAGVVLGAASSAATHAFLPPAAAPAQAGPKTNDASGARWTALRGMVIVMPVFILALQNPSMYLAAIMKTAALGQQAGTLSAKEAGRELIGSTLMGAVLAVVVWFGLKLWPSLWMFTLWMMLATCWLAMRLYRIRPSAHPPSYWMNALITLLIFLGPAVEDSANGKDVFSAAAVRLSLFIAVALYAWAAIFLLEKIRLKFPAPPAQAAARSASA